MLVFVGANILVNGEWSMVNGQSMSTVFLCIKKNGE